MFLRVENKNAIRSQDSVDFLKELFAVKVMNTPKMIRGEMRSDDKNLFLKIWYYQTLHTRRRDLNLNH